MIPFAEASPSATRGFQVPGCDRHQFNACVFQQRIKFTARSDATPAFYNNSGF